MTDAQRRASDADEVIDLPDLTLVPGLMDMEVDLVLGGPGAGLTDPVRMDPVKMGLRAVANGQRTLRAGFTTVRNLGPVHQDRRLPRRRRARRRDRRRLGRGTPGHPRRPRHLPDRRPPRSERAERPGPGHHADDRRGGHRRRGRRGPQGGPLPDHARRQAHQVLRLGRRDDAHRAPRAPSSTRPRSSPRSPTRPTVAASGSPPTATATRPSTPRSTPASTASSTG